MTTTDSLFKGKKAKWLPLFHRFVARMNRVSGVELHATKTLVGLHDGSSETAFAVIRVTDKGLQIGFALTKAVLKNPRLKTLARKRSGISHQTTISDASQIDEEVLLWVRAAQHQARSAKRRG